MPDQSRRQQGSTMNIKSGMASDFMMRCASNGHGAPGKKPGEIGVGLTPRPPDLSKSVTRWNAAQLVWISKHGIKATGMPAFGKTHSDEQLWSLVAFIQQLPSLTPEQYKSLNETTGPVDDHGHDQDHGHGHDDDHEHQH